MTDTAAWLQRYDAAYMPNFGPPKRVLVRGQGCRVWDADGREYLDLLAGIAVNSLGHAHPAMVAAISEQIATLGHISNLYTSPWQVELSERLDALVTTNAPGTEARVFLCNSGSEANDTGFKLTRRTGRTKIVAMEGSFHGRTVGAVSLTAKAAYREPFEPLPAGVVFVPYGDVAALEAAVDDDTAAVVLEPIQGESGVIVGSDDYLRAARRITTEHGALLWVDEVQTGIARTGEWLAYLPSGITPDVVTLAKGLGAGIPIGACIATGPAAVLLGPGSHGSTFGGNPLASRAGLTVLDVIEADGLLAHVREVGDHLADAVMALGHPEIVEVTGRGLLRGIVLAHDIAAAANDRAMEAGFLINAPRPDRLRIAPPLIITTAEIDTFVSALPSLLEG
ncbi:acetylornithine aminotransferase apoenzyme [Raineyella antarctica]|uniref:Acetylornithine aminotransferase n=1 Tax=Raineyella antarctica TaxID=1577474 RepID=A0A1G6HD12_9ACTN|nr:acetylornithine transaminase [Raineyella antarctica]SDB92044.1 acetylornithine aminotransferase apoenzyme [Raineyella antarctica]